MALGPIQNIPDFKNQRQDPFAAILNAYQQKAQMEQQAKMQEEQLKQQRFSNILSAVQTGMSVASQASQIAATNQQRRAKDELVGLLAQRGMTQQPITSPIQQFRPAPGPFAPGQAPAMSTQGVQPTFQQTSQFKATLPALQSAAIGAGIGNEQLGNQLFPNPQAGGLSHSRIEQRNIEIPGIGQMIVSIDPRGGVTTLDGTPVPPELLKQARPAYAPQNIETDEGIKTVSRQGGVVATTKLRGGPIPIDQQETVTDFNQLEPKSQKRFTDLVADAKNKKAITDEVSTLQSMGNIREGIEAKNPAIDAKLGLLFQRALRDTGNIAVVEQAFPGSKQLLDQGQRAYNIYIKNGTVDEKSRDDLRKAVDVLEKSSQNRLNSMVDSESESIWRQARQLDRGFIRESVGGGLYKPLVSENIQITNIDQARALTPEQRRNRIKQLEAESRKKKK